MTRLRSARRGRCSSFRPARTDDPLRAAANQKVRAKAQELAGHVDVVLGNLEDAIPVESKGAARDGLIAMAKAIEFGSTGLWVRVNALILPGFSMI